MSRPNRTTTAPGEKIAAHPFTAADLAMVRAARAAAELESFEDHEGHDDRQANPSCSRCNGGR